MKLKLIDLLKDEIAGIYVDILRADNRIAGIYQGMKEGKFLIRTAEEVNEGDRLDIKVSIGGWNLVFPCTVEKIEENLITLKPLGKVKIREKRKEKRVPILEKCVVDGKKGLMLDVSYHGTRILTLADYNIGDVIVVEVNGDVIRGTIMWMKLEEVDLKSIGVLIEDVPQWWENYVKEKLVKSVDVLRRM